MQIGYDAAFRFWQTYLKVANRGSTHINMVNPAIHFISQSHAGDFDEISDSRYESMIDDVDVLRLFWKGNKLETAGNILLNAMAETEISDFLIEKVAEILASASVNTDYCKNEQECGENAFNPDSEFSFTNGSENPDDSSPRSIYDYLNRHIYGQEAAKRAVSMLMYHHLRGNSRNIVMAGKSGCGKTEIWRALSKVYNCIRIINGPQLTCDGWKGSLKISDIFTGEPEQTAGRLILVIDEADKMLEPHVGGEGTDYSRMLQNELLKLMDGDTLTFVNEKNRDTRITVDCSGVSVVLCGSFERMLQEKTEASGSIGFCRPERKESRISECSEEDLIQYGNVRREIAGRISQIVTLDALDASDFEAIMEGEMSPIKKLEKAHKVSLTVDKDSRKRLAANAAKSGLGCRYIRSRLQSMLDEQMFDSPDENEYSLCYE